VFVSLVPIVAIALVAQQSPQNDTNAMFVERFQIPAYPSLARAASVAVTVTMVVGLAADGVVAEVSTSGAKQKYSGSP
jgi:hypothetical protein